MTDAEPVEEYGVRIESETLFPFRDDVLITRGEAKELRDALDGALDPDPLACERCTWTGDDELYCPDCGADVHPPEVDG